MSTSSSSLPSPPPGFSKTAPLTNHVRVDGTGTASGMGNQTATTIAPMLLMNNKSIVEKGVVFMEGCGLGNQTSSNHFLFVEK